MEASLNMEQLTIFCKQISEYKKNVNNLTTENDTLKQKQEESDAIIKGLLREIADLKERNAELEKKNIGEFVFGILKENDELKEQLGTFQFSNENTVPDLWISQTNEALVKENERLTSENSALQGAVEEFSKQKCELTEQVAHLKEEINVTKAIILKRFGKTDRTISNVPFSIFKVQHRGEEKFILNTVFNDSNYSFEISPKMTEMMVEKKLIEMPTKLSQFAFDKKGLKFYINGQNIMVESTYHSSIIQVIPLEYFDLTSLEMMSHH